MWKVEEGFIWSYKEILTSCDNQVKVKGSGDPPSSSEEEIRRIETGTFSEWLELTCTLCRWFNICLLYTSDAADE